MATLRGLATSRAYPPALAPWLLVSLYARSPWMEVLESELDGLLRGQEDHELLDHLDEREGDDEGVHGGAARRPELLAKLLAARLDEAAADRLVREDADGDGAEPAAHAMHGEDVQGVVEDELVLDALDEAVAEGRGERPMIIAAQGLTKPAAGVMVARPAMARRNAPTSVGLPL